MVNSRTFSMEVAKEAVFEHVRLAGFESMGETSSQNLSVREEVRAMCASDRCQAYGRSWSCPPACGSLEFFGSRIKEKQCAIVFQTVGIIEDDFDFEGMMEAAQLHEKRFNALTKSIMADVQIAQVDSKPLFLGAGTCTFCPQCSYPDAPCRHPERFFVSMEAAGILVSDACEAVGIPYNHGKLTLSYTSCVLFG